MSVQDVHVRALRVKNKGVTECFMTVFYHVPQALARQLLIALALLVL